MFFFFVLTIKVTATLSVQLVNAHYLYAVCLYKKDI